MTDVLKTPAKKALRKALINAALSALRDEGWKVERDSGKVKGRLRRLTKDGKVLLAAIRTSQDGWIAFPRNKRDTKWTTLSDVNVVVAAALDDTKRNARVHMFDAKALRERFDRAYKARKDAGHSIRIGRGIWVSLYLQESDDPVYHIGAGIGLETPPFAEVPLQDIEATDNPVPTAPQNSPAAVVREGDGFEPLTIAQAKIRLARTLGVDPASIKIMVEA